MPATTPPFLRDRLELVSDRDPKHPDGGGSPQVIVPIASDAHGPALLSTAAAFARASAAEIVALRLNAGSPSEEDVLPVDLRYVRGQLPDVPITVVNTDRRQLEGAFVARARHRDVVIAVTSSPCPADPRTDHERLVRRIGCRAAVIYRPELAVPERIVVAVRPLNPAVHSALAAAALARHYRVPVRLLTVLPEHVNRDVEITVRMWLTRLAGDLSAVGVDHREIDRVIVMGRRLVPVIRSETGPGDLIVMGAPEGSAVWTRRRDRRLEGSIATLDRSILLNRPARHPTLIERFTALLRPAPREPAG